jgi:hypothetical protein
MPLDTAPMNLIEQETHPEIDYVTPDFPREVEYGYCQCRCGEKTPLAPSSRARWGWVIRQPIPYLKGHQMRVLARMRRGVIEQPPNPFVRHIALTKGLYTVVDAPLYDWLNDYTWYAFYSKDVKSHYAARAIWEDGKVKHIFMHRQIIGLPSDDKRQGDHQDRDTLNNTGANLRPATIAQNAANKRRTKTQWLRGAHFNKHGGFSSRISVGNKSVYIGRFSTEMGAHLAWLEEAKKLHGKFASED